MDGSTEDAAREHRFRRLYVDLYADVLRFVQRRVAPGGDGGAAEDVTAEVFLAVWRRIDDVPGGGDAARAWVFGIARNLLLNNRRGSRRQSALGVRLADAEQVRAVQSGTVTSGPGEVDVALQVDRGRAWRGLSEVHQEALALSAFEGLDSQEAAVVIGITATVFRLRLSRARKALRAGLGAEHLLPAANAQYSERS